MPEPSPRHDATAENVLCVADLLQWLGCTIIWIIALVKDDRADCDRSDRASCSFLPFEEHNKNNQPEV